MGRELQEYGDQLHDFQMRIIPASIMIEPPPGGVVPTTGQVYEFLERLGRNCYKSEDKMGPGTAEKFIRARLDPENPHYGIIEHHSITVRFIVDRGVSHELVRHRLASFLQES